VNQRLVQFQLPCNRDFVLVFEEVRGRLVPTVDDNRWSGSGSTGHSALHNDSGSGHIGVGVDTQDDNYRLHLRRGFSLFSMT